MCLCFKKEGSQYLLRVNVSAVRSQSSCMVQYTYVMNEVRASVCSPSALSALSRYGVMVETSRTTELVGSSRALVGMNLASTSVDCEALAETDADVPMGLVAPWASALEIWNMKDEAVYGTEERRDSLSFPEQICHFQPCVLL